MLNNEAFKYAAKYIEEINTINDVNDNDVLRSNQKVKSNPQILNGTKSNNKDPMYDHYNYESIMKVIDILCNP